MGCWLGRPPSTGGLQRSNGRTEAAYGAEERRQGGCDARDFVIRARARLRP